MGELTARRGENLISPRKFNSRAGRLSWVTSRGAGGMERAGCQSQAQRNMQICPASCSSPGLCLTLRRATLRNSQYSRGRGWWGCVCHAPLPQICPFQIPPGPSVLGHASNPQPAQLTRGRGFSGQTGTWRPCWGRLGFRVDWESEKSGRKMGIARV